MKILVLDSGRNSSIEPRNASDPRPERAARKHDPARRAQGSIAVSADGQRWMLLNISGDIALQLRSLPQLREPRRLGISPIAGIVLTDTRPEHLSGLLSVRDGEPLDLHATPGVFEDVTAGLPALHDPFHCRDMRWHLVPVAGDRRTAEFDVDGLEGLRFRALAMPDPSPHGSPWERKTAVGGSIALQIEDLRDGQRLFYAPSSAAADDEALAWASEADCLLVHADAFGGNTSEGAAGSSSVRVLSAAGARRKVLIHLHDGDPLLDPRGGERQALEARGIEVAFDGMEIDL